MRPFVNIVAPIQDPFLMALAQALSSRLSYVRHGDSPDRRALINHYLPFSCAGKRLSHIETGYFPAMGDTSPGASYIIEKAHCLDFCICHPGQSELLLREAGIASIAAIAPGIDLAHFAPRLKLGVVGRAYHTGRKGEALVARLMDLDWIDWQFTGEGWPGPALNLADDEMPAFYRSLDYVLVPALYEGGPMCVIEAIACGTEMIAPPIGWVPDFPHIEYKTGDEADLRRVLNGLFEKKKKQAEKAASLSWENCAASHDEVFQKLAAARGISLSSASVAELYERPAIVLATHEEKERCPTFSQASILRGMLEENGTWVPILKQKGDIWPEDVMLAHIFGLWQLDSCRVCVTSAFRYRQPALLSPEFLNSGETRYFEKLRMIFAHASSREVLHRQVASAVAEKKRQIASGGAHFSEAFPGQYDSIRAILARIDRVLFKSEHERAIFSAHDLPAKAASVVRLGVDHERFANADPRIFAEKYGLTDYLLCAGRIEPHGNQLLVAYALSRQAIPLVFIGPVDDSSYRDLVAANAPKRTLFLEETDSELLASAYAGAKVFCSQDWRGGPTQETMAAAAAGCSLVLGNGESEKEYFGEFARYSEPYDPESILRNVLEAWQNPLTDARKKALRDLVASNYPLEKELQATLDAYAAVLSSPAGVPEQSEKQSILYVDLSTSALHNGPPMGMARVEVFYGQEVMENYEGDVRFVLWNKPNKCFIPVDAGQFVDGSYKELASAEQPLPHLTPRGYCCGLFEQGASILIMGGVWTFTSDYTRSLRDAVRDNKLNMIAFVHDLIPFKFSRWYPRADRKEFIENTLTVLTLASKIMADSRCGRQDIKEFCSLHDIACPPINVVRFGDFIDSDALEGGPSDLAEIPAAVRAEPFVLFVSDLNIRKNHVMMLKIWRDLINKHGYAKIPHLVCVGKRGLQNDIFIALADREETTKGKLHLSSRINDGALDWLYRHCLFTVYPSLYEGWGLPVAESLAYGKVTLASNIASIPEIAPEYVDLLDPQDFQAWKARIEAYIFNQHLRAAREEKIANYVPVSWEESAQGLLENLAQKAPNPVEYPVCPLNEWIELDKNNVYAGAGWSFDEGMCSEGGRSVILARLWLKTDRVTLVLRCAAFVRAANEVLPMRISANGRPVASFSIAGSIRNYRIGLENLARDKSGFTEIKIEFEHEIQEWVQTSDRKDRAEGQEGEADQPEIRRSSFLLTRLRFEEKTSDQEHEAGLRR